MGCRRLVVLAAVLVAGCSRPGSMGQVEGVLTRGGRPLHGVQVQFLPDPETGTVGPRSVGLTDEGGRFTLQCDDGRPGAVVGLHAVVLVDAAARITPSKKSQGKAAPRSVTLPLVSGPRFPPDCSAADRTPFQQVEVVEGEQAITLDVLVPRRR